MTVSDSRYINSVVHGVNFPYHLTWKIIITSDNDLFIMGTPRNGDRNDCKKYGCNNAGGSYIRRIVCRDGICNGGKFVLVTNFIELSLFLISMIRANKAKFKYVEV